jgi:CAAX protease family protein
MVRILERRTAVELAGRPGVRLGLLGLAIGLVLCTSVIGSLWLIGAARPAGMGGSGLLATQLSAALMASVGEELLFRAVLFRILEQAMGTLRALLASALFFGLAHIVNPDATIASSLIIALESGIMLGLAFVVTRNLWFPIGIHLAWNFTQGGIFGTAGSLAPPALVQMELHGPHWLTGGLAGTESSAITIIFCVALSVTFAVMARRRRQWISPRSARLSRS